MNRALRIAVVGYGIAGAAAAIQFRRRGHRVEQFERPSEDERAGAGLLLHPMAMPLLEDLGVLGAVLARGAPVRTLSGETVTGRTVMDFRYSDESTDTFGVGIQRQALVDLLHAADSGKHDVIRSAAVETVDARHGLVTLEGGQRHGPYDLIVAADGANSALRRCLAGSAARDKAYRSAALVTLVHDPACWCGDAVRQYFDGPQHVSVWAVGSTPSDPRPLANVSINVPHAQAARWRDNGDWQRAIGRLCPPVQRLIVQDRDRASRPVVYRYRDVQLKRLANERLVLIGDAAHCMSPQLGQGTLLALQDVHSLARLLDLSDDPRSALACFDVQRRRQVRPIQALNRLLTPFFQSDSRVLAGIRDLGSGSVSGFPVVQSRLRSMFVTAPRGRFE